MGRIKRYFEEGYPYFITTITYKRLPIFIDEKMIKIILVTLEYFKLILEYKIYAYCVMPDHIHLVIQSMGKYDISYIMKMVKGSFARKYNKITSKSGTVWQERFFDEGMRNDAVLLTKIEYVHNNPVRAGMVTAPEEYKFSSYGHYFNSGNANNSLLEIDIMDI